ncbi:hypothetical protein A9Q84_05875 [Halobacteriovorax marinus]|uniref:Uncharacterized protein n=1 Tax=Halobacteriovorax marinus TaxID=97084 RepID=A0A1Y5FB79_9BACT|nr:hypothetical protein A9Q84_05875 [Halobacteriovorax marinus]
MDTVRAFNEISPLDVLQLHELGFKESEYKDIETSAISVNDFRVFLKKSLQIHSSDSELDEIWNKMLHGISKQKVKFIRALGEKYELAVLSNTNKIHKDFFEVECQDAFGPKGLHENFKKVYYSHEIKLRKPSSEIYEYILNDLARKPEECLFIDDSIENINVAKALGIKTLFFERNDLFENYSELLDLLN